MIEVTGDLWEFGPVDARVITTNGATRPSDGKAVMGRGCAREAAQRWPGLEVWFGLELRRLGNHVMALMREITDGYRWLLVSFPVKDHWRDEANPYLIARSAVELVALADQEGWSKVVLPRPGCGNGRLTWDVVAPIIAPILDDRFHVITFPETADA